MTFNVDNQLLTWKASAAAAQSVVHDDDWNTTAGPLPDLSSPAAAARWASFGFDARNRLTSVSATGVSSTHSYDAENLRTSSTESGVTSQWVINPHGLSGMSEALVRVKGGVTTRYVYGLGLLYEEEEAATPVVRTYHFDRQGSTAALTATDGLTVTDRFEYAAYGERTYRTGSTDTPFQFNGFFGVQTDASGLLYMRARYYNVETRRFQSADPMGFAESSNFYWFANADPVSLVDPFGLGASDGGGFWSGVGRVLGAAANFLVGENFGRVWIRLFNDFSGLKGEVDRFAANALTNLSDAGINPQINDNKFGHASSAYMSQKQLGLLGFPLVALSGIGYKLVHFFKPGHVQGQQYSGWGGPAPYFGFFDGQHPINWVWDTPGDVIGNTMGQIGALFGADSMSWNSGALAIPGPNYSNSSQDAWTQLAAPGMTYPQTRP